MSGEQAQDHVWADAAEHVAAYEASDGAVGHDWLGRPHLLLRTTGRRTGRVRTVPLAYARLPVPDGTARYVVAASAGGAERHPAWYLNLVADPRVEVQVRAQRWSTTADPLVDEPHDVVEGAWAALTDVWSGFGRYRAGTRRRIPVVLLAAPAAVDRS